MLNKTIIAFTAAVVLGSTSAAFSWEDPENKIGDRYPSLDQSSRPSAYTARNIGGPYVPTRQSSRLNQGEQEDVESRIADKYPTLEPAVPAVSAASILRTRVAAQQVSLRVYYEDPESRIGDKYPLLVTAPQSSRTGYVTARARHGRRV